jgi:hypothetical protein
VKALVCNSGVDMAPAGYPSNQEGWGRLQADNALHFPGDNKYLVVRDVWNAAAEALRTDGVRELRVNVTDATVPLRATMAYSDQPATVPATVATVNDLDLIVISPAGDVFLGNNLVGGWSVPGGLPDPINTLEQVRIQTPQTGVWTVRVRGTAVNVGPQGYGLCVVGGISEAACPGDFNQDGALDFFDYLDFVQAFSAGTGDADVNHDNVVDFFDYLDFVAAFAMGC